MFRKLTFAVGFGAGYAVRAKAGKDRSARLGAVVRKAPRLPAVQQLAANVSSTAATVASSARSAADRTVRGVTDRLSPNGADSAVIVATSGTATLSDSVSIDELSDKELDFLTTPDPSR